LSGGEIYPAESGEFYTAVDTLIGAAKSVIALARKIVVIIWHLLTNDELYDDGL